MQVKQIQIKAKVTPHNAKQVAEAMAALGDLIRQFKEINTQEEIDEHVARINGYAYALVNMDVIAEETANTQVAYAACAAAAARQEELERLKGKWQ